MSKQSVFYEDRRYFALAAGKHNSLEPQAAMMVVVTGNSTKVAHHDPVFVFRHDRLVAKYEIVGAGEWQSIPATEAGEARWLVPVLVTMQSSETKALTNPASSDDPKTDFLLRHARRQVVDAVVASLTASRKEWDSAGHLIPVKLGDQLLDAYQLPYTDYHWSDVA